MKFKILILWCVLLGYQARCAAQVSSVQQILADMSLPLPMGVMCAEPEFLTPLLRVSQVQTQGTPSCYNVDAPGSPYVPLNENEHRLMTADPYLNASGVSKFFSTGNYLLRRLPENRYQAVLNLNFVAPTGGDSNLGSQMMEKTRECLNRLRPYLKGPQGESLEILALSNDEVEMLPGNFPRPGSRNINVIQAPDDRYRGDAGNFGTNFDCITIGHEILHHLGLCDEYHETSLASSTPDTKSVDQPALSIKDAWSCRVVTTRPSYMRNMIYAFNRTVAQSRVCECDIGCRAFVPEMTENMSKMFYGMSGNDIFDTETGLEPFCKSEAYPDDLPYSSLSQDPDKSFAYIGQTVNTYKFESRKLLLGEWRVKRVAHTCDCSSDTNNFCARMMEQFKQIVIDAPRSTQCPTGASLEHNYVANGVNRIEGNKLIISHPGEASLLSPNHFNKILSGNCQGGSPNYERCSEFAYMNRSNPACVVPPECLDDNYFLGPRSSQR